MFKYIFLLIVPFAAHTQDRLASYYSGEITLTTEQIVNLSNDNIQSGTDYQKALSHYLLAIRDRKQKENLAAWQHYDQAYLHLLAADTTDHILASAILRNQGAIAKDYLLHQVRIDKYKNALPHAQQCDQLTTGNYANFTTREASTLYNLGRAYKDAGQPDDALYTFEELRKQAPAGSKYLVRAYRETAMLMKEQKKYKESEANFYQAEKEATGVSNKIKMWVYHDWASLYKEMGAYEQQEEKLRQAIRIKSDFRTLMDMGECLMLQQKNEAAIEVLQQAEQLYQEERISEENIKVFDYLAILTTDKVGYLTKSRDELRKYAQEQEQIKEETTSLAFANAIKEIQRNRIKEERIALFIKVLWQILWTALAIGTVFGANYLYKKNRYQSKYENHFTK